MMRARPRVLVLSPARLFASFFTPELQRRLSRSFDWKRLHAPAGSPRLARALRGADALVTTWDSPSFDAALLEDAPRLRFIAHCGGEVKARFAAGLFDRLTIVNAPAPMARYVAELAAAFLLYAARDVDAYRRALRGGGAAVYARLHRDGGGDTTLLGRPVGLLGFGRIGRALVDLLRPFGVLWRIHDPYVPASEIRRHGATPVRFADLLGERLLVVAAALTPRTRGLFDARALARLPDSATLVNVARGGLVDLEALTREVVRGRLRCAVDVTDPHEPLPRRHPLRRARGAIVTPHVGASQRAVRLAMALSVAADLERFFRGRPVRNRVTRDQLERMT
jgi:phosphoglycerate dehydrogenase-like enzyme